MAGQLLAATIRADVRDIYGIVGDSLNPIVDAVRRPRLRRGRAAGETIDRWVAEDHQEAVTRNRVDRVKGLLIAHPVGLLDAAQILLYHLNHTQLFELNLGAIDSR